MANRKFACECGAVLIYKDSLPTHCAFCKKSTGVAPKVALNVRKLRSVWSGKSANELKNEAIGFLGAGVDRKVYALDDETVVKFSPRGARANRLEVQAWLTASDELKPWLAPIIDWDEVNYEWLVMARANNVKRNQDQYRADFNEVRDQIPYHIRRQVGDVHGANVGKINGKPVIIDYVGFGADWAN